MVPVYHDSQLGTEKETGTKACGKARPCHGSMKQDKGILEG